MAKLSDIMQPTAETVRIALIKPGHKVLFEGNVSAVKAGSGLVIQNEAALKEAYPDGEVIYLLPTDDVAVDYEWVNGKFGPPDIVPKFEPYEIFAMFSKIERTRYFAALDAGDVDVRTVAEMMRLQSGKSMEGTHPVVQSALFVLRTTGILDSDLRLTELGEVTQKPRGNKAK
jgi:hypothetical protein